MEEKLEIIASIIEEVTDIPKEDISADSKIIDDLDISSLELMSITSEIARKFSVKIPEKAILDFETIGDIIEFLG